MENIQTVTDSRAIILENIRNSFDFGQEVIVEDMGGWNYEQPGSIATCSIFVRTDEKQEDSTRLTFTVVFANDDSSELIEAYAIDSKGIIWS